MIKTKRFSLSIPYLAMALALGALFAPRSAHADENSGWVYQNWESVKAGVSVDGAGNWYAWGSVWFDGKIVETDDHQVLWVKGELYKWDGSKPVLCTQTEWFHPQQRAAWAYRSGTAADGHPLLFPCGSGHYFARVWAYSRVWTPAFPPATSTADFHGGYLNTNWTWVTQP